MRQPDDEGWIADMLASSREAVELLAHRSAADLKADRVLQLALTHLVEIVGEAARRVSPDGKATRNDIPWQAIMGMRNRLAHEYRHVDLAILYETVRSDLPLLIRQLNSET